jgi:hypothetical protein
MNTLILLVDDVDFPTKQIDVSILRERTDRRLAKRGLVA